VSACLLVGIVWLGVREQQRTSELSAALAAARGDLSRVSQILTFLNEPETRSVSFGAQTPVPRGRILLNPTRGVILLASNLPPATQGRIYEMWLIPKSGPPKPAGLFQSERNGSALHVLNQTVDLSAISAVAVTVEPESGSPA